MGVVDGRVDRDMRGEGGGIEGGSTVYIQPSGPAWASMEMWNGHGNSLSAIVEQSFTNGLERDVLLRSLSGLNACVPLLLVLVIKPKICSLKDGISRDAVINANPQDACQ